MTKTHTVTEVIEHVIMHVKRDGQCEVYAELMNGVLGDYKAPTNVVADNFYQIFFSAWRDKGYTIRKSGNGISWMVLGEPEQEFSFTVQEGDERCPLTNDTTKELIISTKVWKHYSTVEYLVKHNRVFTSFVDFANAKYAYSLLKD